MRISPNNVITLGENEIFVFGSNEAGIYGFRATLAARKNWGAIFEKGVDLYGKTYAIPTIYTKFII